MKLAYIVNKINGTSGIQRMVTFQINYFVKKYRFNVDLILLNQDEEEEKNFYKVDSTISFHFLKTPSKSIKRYYTLVRSVNKTLRNINPNIVVVCESDIFSLYLPKIISGNYKMVYQRHDIKGLNLNTAQTSVKTIIYYHLKRRLLAKAGRHFDKFVLLSEAHREDWNGISNIEVISNPIIIDTKGDQAKLENKQVLAVGRHDPIKGFDMLLRCWKKIVKNHPDWKLIIVGKRTHSINLKNLAQKLSITDSVVFRGHTKDMSKVYLESSIFICSSRIEAFPLVILEAMSFGVPVVSFDCDYGPREIISNSIDGILVPQNNINVLADSTCHLIKNSHIRKEMGEMASKNIKRYSVDKIMNQWKALFEELV